MIQKFFLVPVSIKQDEFYVEERLDDWIFGTLE